MPPDPGRPDDDNRKLDDLTDDQLADFEESLHQAAREHRIDIEPAQPAPLGMDDSKLDLDELATTRAAELEQKIQEISAASRGQARSEDDEGLESLQEPEVEETLKRLESVAAQARARKNTGLKSEEDHRRSDREAALGAGIGMSVAFTIIGLPIFGYLVGKLIDGSSGRTTWTNALVLIGAAVGIAVAIYQLNRFSKRND